MLTNTYPNWAAPSNISAFTTQRHGGFSEGLYASNNLGLHVGDDPNHVKANRSALSATLPNEPEWLEQTHSTTCVTIENTTLRQADASITRTANRVLAIMTADCLPILLCNKQGTEIAAIHAGWRGLVNGIIENTLTQMTSLPSDLCAWIGPSICSKCYEVGDEVYETYKATYPFSTPFFKRYGQKWLSDIPGIAEEVLKKLAVSRVYQSHLCTFEQKNDFYSYRREAQTGRIVTLIWLTNN
ncbi:Laccase domain protein yfiH [Legionella beliardensis]|uniref:Purine nucleoside phosphorylase n=1 Tax=Legionella beliardensis TaxID=91822 RepID=A0A378I225_9GAMM|nr:peptidoglycan editing factor PgeF [Legionella beliardensis]STX28751.1 Laccase domain protein yfiH [Legionella beliardensis]